MQELSHSHGHTLDPSTESTPLFGAEVDLAPGEIMPLGVLTDSLDEVYVKPKRRGRVTFWIAAGWLGVVIFLAVFADYLPFVDSYSAGSVLDGKLPPSLDHWMGTDVNGRDIFSRWVYGARVSLAIGAAAIIFGITIGGLLGLLAGYKKKRTDSFIVTIMDILLAFPALVLALMLVTFGQAPDGGDRTFSMGPFHYTLSRLWLVIFVLGVLSIPPLTRIVRASTMSFANREFVMASRALGAKSTRVMSREILPNVVPPMLSFALTGLAVLIVAEGALAFLGLSVRPPTPSWGFMIFEGKNPLQSGQWWISLLPALFMFLTILAINMLGDVAAKRFEIRDAVGVKKGQLSQNIVSHRTVSGPLLEVEDLRTHFRTDRGMVRAVDGVSFSLARGKTLGVVGESGSGKTILSRSVMGLLPNRNVVREGRVVFEGQEIGNLPPPAMREIWGTEMAMVFQDPMTSLNPVMKIGRQITESLKYHLHMSKKDATATAEALLKSVGIPEPARRLQEYPHQLSGGMRQRVTIAIAIACGPTILFADEPTTALDVTVQAQILDLLQEQQRERNMSMVLVTHDLGVVAGRTDEIAVMYAGKIVEKAPTNSLFSNVRMPYTEALLKSIPKLDNRSHSRLEVIAGRPPDLINPPKGCRFSPRCAYAQDRCREEEPTLQEAEIPGHTFACFYPVGSPEGKEALERNRAAAASAAASAAPTSAAPAAAEV